MDYVEFADGHTEEILFYTGWNDALDFRTPSGNYAYRSWINELENGITYRDHCFYNIDTGKPVDISTAVITKSL